MQENKLSKKIKCKNLINIPSIIIIIIIIIIIQNIIILQNIQNEVKKENQV